MGGIQVMQGEGLHGMVFKPAIELQGVLPVVERTLVVAQVEQDFAHIDVDSGLTPPNCSRAHTGSGATVLFGCRMVEVVEPDNAGGIDGIEAGAGFVGEPDPGAADCAGGRRLGVARVDLAAPDFDAGAYALAEDAVDHGGEEVEDVADLEEEQEGLPGPGVEEVAAVDPGEGLELRELAGAELVHEGEARHAGAGGGVFAAVGGGGAPEGGCRAR